MAAKPHSPVGDVSCRATGYSIQQLQRMELPTAHLTHGLGWTLDELRNQSSSIPWDDYLVFLRNSHSELSPDQVVELCTSYKGSSYFRPLLSAAGLWFHPARYFEKLADPEVGTIQQLYRCVSTRFTRINDREVVFEEVIKPGFAMPPDVFWEAHSIAFGALTTYFGLAPSIVTWEPIARGAAFQIRLPRHRPVRFALSWLASWFQRDTAEDVRNALLFGHERSVRLEREIAERKVAETALRASEERFRYITEAVPGVIYQYYLDSDGNDGFTFVSAGAVKLTGYTPEEVIAQPDRIWGRINPDDIPALQHSIQESARNGTLWQYVFRLKTRAGDIRWVSARSIPEPITASGRIQWNGILYDVTAEKHAESQLQARDALLQKLSEQVPGVIYQYQQWPDGRSCFPYASEGIRGIYEVTPEEVRISTGTVFGRLHADDFRAVAESIHHSLESLEPWRCEYRVQLPKRGLRWLDGHAVPERLPDGSTIWHGYIRDVTERKLTEEMLRLKDTAIATSLNAITMSDADGRIIYINRSFLQMWGYDHDEEILGRMPSELFEHPEKAEVAIQTLRASGDWVGELRGIRRDGTAFDTAVSANTIRDSQGKPVKLMASFIDITERKAAEQALVEEKRLLQAMFGSLPGIAFAFDQSGSYVRWNHNYDNLLGWSDEEMMRLTALDTVVPRDRERVAEAIRDVFHLGENATELHALRKDGRELPLYCSGVRVTLGGKQCVVGFGIDISDRLKAEAALRASEERLRIFIESAPAGVAMFDQEMRYISHSRRWLTDYDLGNQNLIGRSHYEVFPEITDRWKEIHSRCLTGVSERCEQDQFERADGSIVYLRWEIQPWTDATGAIGGLVFLTEMITDRVRAEAQIRASLREKEAILKEIHHRVKNNMQVISSLLSLQAAQVTTHPVAADVLAESQNRVRAMALVHETLYRSDDLARVDLAHYIEELCGYLFRSFGVDPARIKLVLDVQSVTVSLDKTIPCGLLMNEIVSNSLKYAFPGTRAGTVSIRASMQPDGLLALTLSDDGVGLPMDLVIDSTPTLGLQLVHILTDQLGGRLALERFGGTRYRLSFAP